jgi:putative ABC transport system ATP-binding protein
MTGPEESAAVPPAWQPERQPEPDPSRRPSEPDPSRWQPEPDPSRRPSEPDPSRWQPEPDPSRRQPEPAPWSPDSPVWRQESRSRESASTPLWPNGQPPALAWTAAPASTAPGTADPPPAAEPGPRVAAVATRTAEPGRAWFEESGRPPAPAPVRPGSPPVRALLVDAVSVAYGRDRPVLHDVSVVVEPGRMLAVTGSSGAGKTTLLWAMAGLLRPVRGSVALGGTPLRDHDHAVAERVVLIPQDNGLAPILTAQENVQVALIARGASPADARRRTAESLERLGLSGQADQLVEELSGGQQQRAAIARGLALRGEVLLADEVTSELDAANRQRVLELLREEARRGAAVVFATHDPEAAAACDAQLHLVDGAARLRG